MEQYRLRSNLLGNERRTSVYLPPGYSRDGEPCPLLILFDDWIYADVAPTPTILDNLIASGALPPVVAVLLSCVNLETRNRELPCNPAFSDFLVQELMPWVHQRFQVTDQPSRTVLGGASYGGLAAAYAAFRHPDVFGKILSQSGSFGWKPQGDPEYEWLSRQFVVSPRLNLSFYLEAGLLDTGTDSGDDSGDEPSNLVASRHMRDVLLAKGYPVRYSEYNGGHNAVCWEGSLADGLLALLGNEKIS
jgi:enterochelin esterase family protein